MSTYVILVFLKIYFRLSNLENLGEKLINVSLRHAASHFGKWNNLVQFVIQFPVSLDIYRVDSRTAHRLWL